MNTCEETIEVHDLALQGLKILVPKVFKDHRGYFLESYRRELLAEGGIDCDFVQDNRAMSRKGTIRGMHYQGSPGQAKLVSVAKGKIYDVAVDIRKDSPTFGRWFAVFLDDQEHKSLFIPAGFAHGYCVLSEEAIVTYKVSNYYDPKEERGFRYDDPEVGISWPIDHVVVSDRDLACPSFRKALG
ncbi:MAG: dTDP-4-dehydrorhamnose 3,5-epimerase [Candidatus Algichlamydia australiensis]|nr:dTDP-4-dehydrorhamnose 3,5-epimerase [Chlamydiales bacterium]